MVLTEVCTLPVPAAPAEPRPPTRGEPRMVYAAGLSFVRCSGRAICDSGRAGASALALLVTRVRADDHDPAVPANDPALVADLLNARLDLHGVALLLV